MTPLLFLGLFGLSAWVMKKFSHPGHDPTLPKGQRVIILDEKLPDADAERAIHAVLYEKNPASLDAIAATFEKRGFPCTHYELAYRAWELRGASGPPPGRPTSCGQGLASSTPSPAPAPNPNSPFADLGIPGMTEEVALEACKMIDPTLPGDACAAVLKALATEHDPAKLEAFAASLAQDHPRAAATLQQQALRLRQQKAQAQAHAEAQAQAQAKSHAGGVPMVAAETSPGEPFKKPEVQAPAMEPALEVAASLSPKLHGTTTHTEGTTLAEAAVSQAASQVQGGPPFGADPFRGGHASVRPQRPRGHWFVFARPHDTPWPMTLVKLATGKKDPSAQAQLFAMNPHLWTTPGSGVIAQFKPGDEINVPGAWSEALIRRGLKLKKD